ncbi:hypothetical protein IPL68_01305 [Candidatus Saccharibacteria bacterium]|nr:MAG: hypothetical protein IPL68_01305 [Candidatus Saccharibacteria bacterium]
MYIVLLIAFVNILLAFMFHHVAEAQYFGMLFATVFIALFHLARLVRVVFRTRSVLKIATYTLLGIFLTLFTLSTAVFTIGYTLDETPKLESAASFGLLWSILFFLPHVRQRHDVGTKIFIQMVVAFYTSLILLVAGIGYVSAAYTGATMYILIIALQLQYIMNFIVTETEYIIRLEERCKPMLDRLHINDSSSQNTIILAAGAVPFFIPLTIVVSLV